MDKEGEGGGWVNKRRKQIMSCLQYNGEELRTEGMRMEKKGIKKVSGFGHGDHYINIKVIS